MKFGNLVFMTWQNVRRNKLRVLLSSTGIVFGLAMLIFFMSLSNGARGLIFNNFLEQLPEDQVKINPPYRTDLMGYLTKRLMGGRKQEDQGFNEGKIAELRLIEGVEAIYGVMNLDADVYLEGTMPGIDRKFSTRYALVGVERPVVEDSLPADYQWTYAPSDPEIPALINASLLTAFNETLSITMGLPKVTMDVIRQLDVYIHASDDRGEYLDKKIKIVGVSARAPLLGILVPMEAVLESNRLIFPGFKETYSALYINAKERSFVPSIIKKITQMGYTVAGEQRTAETIDTGLNFFTFFLTAISIVIVVISLLNIVNILLINVLERKYEIGVMRAVGAKRNDVRLLILGESAAVGLANGVAGILIGVGAVLLAEAGLHPLLEKFILTEFTIFAISPELLLVILVATPLVCVLAAFHPANYAASLDPVEALRR